MMLISIIQSSLLSPICKFRWKSCRLSYWSCESFWSDNDHLFTIWPVWWRWCDGGDDLPTICKRNQDRDNDDGEDDDDDALWGRCVCLVDDTIRTGGPGGSSAVRARSPQALPWQPMTSGRGAGEGHLGAALGTILLEISHLLRFSPSNWFWHLMMSLEGSILTNRETSLWHRTSLRFMTFFNS